MYLIARGSTMQERQERRARAADAEFRNYVRQAAASDSNASPASNGGAPSASDELAKLAGLHQRGVLNDDEFARAKAKVV